MVIDIVIIILLFVLSFVSGMLGLGVAFIAIPVLGFFGFDLKDVIMPWALLLNGLTAISAAIAFLRKKMVDLKTAISPSHHNHCCRTNRCLPSSLFFTQICLVDFCACAHFSVCADVFPTEN